MTLHQPQSDRDFLESLYQKSPSASIVFQWQKFLGSLWGALRMLLTRNSHYPRIHRYFDVDGVVIWHVYDPVTRETLTSRSELEISAWLEQRYSQQVDPSGSGT